MLTTEQYEQAEKAFETLAKLSARRASVSELEAIEKVSAINGSTIKVSIYDDETDAVLKDKVLEAIDAVMAENIAKLNALGITF